MLQNVPELLAPAGNMQAFKAALAAGADAVYLGLDNFNARRNADNFTLDTLQEACDLAHLAGARVYLTLNIGIKPQEFEKAFSLAGDAYHAGIDALIVQDLGLLTQLHQRLPHIELHASTQLNIHSAAGVELMAQQGAKVVTLARECSLEEVKACVEAGRRHGVGIEVFGHGALCICYSGQCLMSSLIGGRSANRGLCAQPCRLPWHLIDTSTGKTQNTEGEYLLSPKDLCTIDILPQLVETGVASLKVEGRMKSPEYVALVTGVYRRALDQISVLAQEVEEKEDTEARATYIAQHYHVSKEEKDRLEEAFSRGFTTGYLAGQRGNDIMSYKRPNNRGVQVGRVLKVGKGLVTVAADEDLEAGDLLEFWTNKGRCTVEVPGEINRVTAGTSFSLKVPKPVSPGDRVFRVRNARLMREASALFDDSAYDGGNGFISLAAQVVMRAGQPLTIGFALTQRPEVTGRVQGDPVEPARTKAISKEDILEHVGRLGGTPYRVDQWDIQLDDGVGIGFSALHRLRREALDALEEASAAPYRQRVSQRAPKDTTPRIAVDKRGLQVAVLVRDLAGAKAAKQAGARYIYQQVVPLEGVGGQKAAKVSGFAPVAPFAIPVLPSICHDGDEEALYAHVMAGEPVVCGTLAQIVHCKKLGALPEAASNLCTLNRHSVNALADLGVEKIWLSPELSGEDIAEFGISSPVSLGITVFGRQELMVTEHCQLMPKGPCAQDCFSCPRRKSPHLLEDRKGYRFPVRTDENGRSHIYNSVPLDLTAFIPEVAATGISNVMIDASLMTTKEIADEVTRLKRGCDIALRCGEHLGKREGATTGHFFKAVQ